MLTLKEKYENEKKEILQDAEQIETATDWRSYLMHGSACDSSKRAHARIEWVERATHEFVEQNKKTILKMAAEMCRDSIGE